MEKPVVPNDLPEFMAAYRHFCRHYDDEVRVERVAARLDWSVERVRTVAWWAYDHRLIDIDAGMGEEMTMLVGLDDT